MKTKPYVYLAGPYTQGDPAINTHAQCVIFNTLLTDGVVTPYAPLWCHYQHGVRPRPYQTWIDYDIAILESSCFDACLRCGAHAPELGYYQWDSSGADNEVQWFEAHGLPVFHGHHSYVNSTSDAIQKLYNAVHAGVVGISQPQR